LNNKALELKPIGFIDDDAIKTGKKLQGYPIMGTFADLNNIIARHPVTTLLISFDDTHGADKNQITRYCRKNHLNLKRFRIQVESMNIESP